MQSTRVCREHVRIELALPEFPPSTPGQFVQLLCRETIEANTAQPAAARDGADAGIARWRADVADGFPSIVDRDFSQRRPFLRRPFSIADRWRAADGDVRLVVISRTIGAGTAWLEQLRAGDTLNLTGPLGHGFEIPVADVPVVLAGGGVGIPPLLYLARRLRELGRRDVTVVLGATTRALLPVTLSAAPAREATPSRCVELPGGAPYPALIATDDGTAGVRGFVTDALARWWTQRATGRAAAGVERSGVTTGLVYACGPEGMLKAVAALTCRLGLACQLCIERSMGCGIGTCLSCVVRAHSAGSSSGWRWALACTDGPVFERDVLLDYAGPSGA